MFSWAQSSRVEVTWDLNFDICLNQNFGLTVMVSTGCKSNPRHACTQKQDPALNQYPSTFTFQESHELNGFVTYSDYARDYMPPPSLAHHHNHVHMNNLRDDYYGASAVADQPGDNLEPWYSAGYANPYLSRNSMLGGSGHLPPPHTAAIYTSPVISPASGAPGLCRTVASNSMTSPTTATTTTTTVVSALSKNQHVLANNDNLANFDQMSPTTHV